jgi:hypothetical protein
MSTISTTMPAAARPRASTRPRGPLVRRVLTTTAAAVVALLGGITVAEPASAATPIYFGSVDGGYAAATTKSGERLANHAYSTFTSKPPTARMITVHAGGYSWRQVANAQPGSALYNNIVRWAQTIKARGGHVMVAYNHEPEAAAGGYRGTASEFIAAWRKVVTIFRNQGASNVEWTWQMTAYAFKVRSSDARYAAKWYPGDAYVDNVGADAYNWNICGEGSGRHNELSTLGAPVLAFAKAHGKKASFPEFASNANSSRTQWLRNAHQYLASNQGLITAAFYFNRSPTVASNNELPSGTRSGTSPGTRASRPDPGSPPAQPVNGHDSGPRPSGRGPLSSFSLR